MKVDSQSVITTISSLIDTNNMLVQLVCTKINHALQNGHHILICWVQRHEGILGNEKGDGPASSSRNLQQLAASSPHQDIKPVVRAPICRRWQTGWDKKSDK